MTGNNINELIQSYRARIINVKSPEFKIHELKGFNLANIPTKFQIADFERVRSATHIKGIKDSIVNNTFFDNIVRVVKHKDKDWFVIDGQHRLAALYLLYTEYGLKTYDLVVIEYNAECARNVYRKINVGKPLSVAAHLKALDDGRVVFFNELRSVLSHDDHKNLWTFKEALECLFLAKTNATFLGQRTIERALSLVSAEDIEFLKVFNRALIASNPTKQRGLQFKPLFHRHCFIAAYRKRLNVVEIGNLISKGLSTKEIMENVDTYTADNKENLQKIFDRLAIEATL